MDIAAEAWASHPGAAQRLSGLENPSCCPSRNIHMANFSELAPLASTCTSWEARSQLQGRHSLHLNNPGVSSGKHCIKRLYKCSQLEQPCVVFVLTKLHQFRPLSKYANPM